ncbi:epoxide hydrolase family protein [Kitasatospora sp. NPDC059463]|uniref:epoxide hydrolase family protein n=1 Tax=unclassified Kitasatospora TaxID=2633591 RepID=UPI0036C6BBD6
MITDEDAVRPFRLAVPQGELDELRLRIARTRWPDDLPGAGWSYGVAGPYLRELAEYWTDGYDWRAHEAELNAFPQFTTTIDGQNVHFLHVRSPEPDALPLVLTHGWPSTVHDFTGVLGPLTDPRAHGGDPADAFHVVAPSLPGFAHSGPTTAPGWGTRRIAAAWAELMRRLGYPRYGAQGGDFGAIVSPELGRVAPDRVIGVHLNAPPTASAPLDAAESALLTADERARAGDNARWWQAHSGYATQMSTRPQTVAYALNDSPVGQLAWNLEFFVDHDPVATRQTLPSWDAVLTDVTAFWLTGTAGSAARLYREIAADGWGRPAPSGVPTGVAVFRGDRAIRTLAELSHTVTRWTAYDTGGHFASLQAPEPLVADVRAFFRTLR